MRASVTAVEFVNDNRAAYPNVGVSIVAYKPEAEALQRLLAAIAGQFGAIVVIDNEGATAAIGAGGHDGIDIIDPGGNIGVAAGHNLSLLRIFAAGCSHALLFDQDSLPQGDMVGELLRIEQALLADGRAVGAIGPMLVAADDRLTGFIRFSGLWRHIPRRGDADLPVPACRSDFLITSGTLLRREVFERVGPFDENLFIDNVDLEWCCRATSLGFACYGAVEARMEHALGDYTLHYPLARRLIPTVHNPMRIYYITRNRLLLYSMPHVPPGWKLADFPRMVAKIVLFGLLVPPRLRYLRASLAGFLDGLRGRGGPSRKPF